MRVRACARAVGVPDRRRLAVAAVMLTLVVAGVVLRPGVARAGWPLEAPAGVALGFGAVYSAGDGSAQHRGVDLTAGAGDRVVAPVAGRVSFVGSVPGVGGAGGRVTAVTIETGFGKVTLMPLERASVSRGEQVGEGAGIGALAGSGDGSSAAAHLHVGVRVGDLYVDPLGFIAPPAAPAQGGGSGDGVTVGSGAEAADSVAGVGAGMAAGVTLAPSGDVAGLGAGQPAAVPGEISPGVSVAVRGKAAAGAQQQAATTRGARAPQGRAGTAQVQATVLTADGVVVAASAAAPAAKSAPAAWLAQTVARARGAARRTLQLAGLVLLGVMAALGALWPLWRAGRKDAGKVRVRAAGEDVAAAPSR